jgi:hypothetical protein
MLAFNKGPVYSGGVSQTFSQLQKLAHKKKMQIHRTQAFLNPTKPESIDI